MSFHTCFDWINKFGYLSMNESMNIRRSQGVASGDFL